MAFFARAIVHSDASDAKETSYPKLPMNHELTWDKLERIYAIRFMNFTRDFELQSWSCESFPAFLSPSIRDPSAKLFYFLMMQMIVSEDNTSIDIQTFM